MMRGLWLLSWRHLALHRTRTAIVVACLAIAGFVPALVHVLVERYQTELTARADATPLIAGARGSRFDLTLATLWFRPGRLPTLPFATRDALADGAIAIPMHVRYTARGRPLVGTGIDYFQLRRLRPAAGTLPLQLGDCVLGAHLARSLDLHAGDALLSDPVDVYDLSKPPALKMRVCGVLAASGSPDDDAAFVDVKTCWILDGLAHGHEEADRIDPGMVAASRDGTIAVRPELWPWREVTEANVASFHIHSDAEHLPLSAIIVVPADAKSSTLLKARTNAGPTTQMVVPGEVIDELLQVVFRIRTVLDLLALVLGVAMLALLLLQLWLSMRLRQGEMATLRKIGCSRGIGVALQATELLMIVAASAVLAAGGVWLAQALLPDLWLAL